MNLANMTNSKIQRFMNQQVLNSEANTRKIISTYT